MWKFLKKHVWLFALIVLFILFPQSLSNQAKLNMKTLIPGLAIDKVESGYEITAQVITPSRGSESGGSAIRATFVSETGATIADAIERLGYSMGKSAGLGHVNFLIVGESMLENNLVGELDYFLRDKKTSNSILLLTCDGSAKDQIKKTEKLEASTGIGLQKVFLYKQQSTNGYMIPIMEVANSVYSKSKACVINGFEIEENKEQESSSSQGSSSSSGGSGSSSSSSKQSSSTSDKPDGRIKYLNKLTCFVDGEKVGELKNEDEILGFLIINRHSSEASLDLGEIEFDDQTAENFNIKYYRKSQNTKVEFNNGTPKFKIDIKLADVKLRSLNTKTSPSIEFYKEANKEFENKIKTKIKDVISRNIMIAFEKSKQLNCDIFQLSDMTYQNCYYDYKRYIENNPNYLQNFEIEINIDIDKLT